MQWANVLVVFYGYPNTPSTKYSTQRRSTGRVSTAVKYDRNNTENTSFAC